MTHPTRAELVEAMARAIHEGRNGPVAAWLSRAKAYRQPYLTDADRALATLCTLIPGLPALLDGTARVVPVDAVERMLNLKALYVLEGDAEWTLTEMFAALNAIAASPYASPTP